MAAARGQGEEGSGSSSSLGAECHFGKMKTVLRTAGGDGSAVA